MSTLPNDIDSMKRLQAALLKLAREHAPDVEVDLILDHYLKNWVQIRFLTSKSVVNYYTPFDTAMQIEIDIWNSIPNEIIHGIIRQFQFEYDRM